MKHNAAPLSSPDRLATLREAVAGASALGPALNRLTQLAAQLLQAPIAYIVLGDAERQMILSATGMPGRLSEDAALMLACDCFTPSDRSLLPLLVDNTRAGTALDRVIAAFAGVRLLSAGGAVIGALCVADSAQHIWSAGDQACLADLAPIVAQTIESHCDLSEQAAVAESARLSQAGLEQHLADETAQREALAYALVEAQKRESFITLVGGIAHNFNNLLATILGNAELALLELPPDSPAQASIVPITIAAQRAAALNRQMLMYAGEGHFLLQALDTNALVADMSEVLGASIARRVMLTIELAPQLPAMVADATQIRQALAHLIANAVEAIGDADGTICVKTGVCELDEVELATLYHAPELPAGTYVTLAISDSGSGMDAATSARIFDPFFTTKVPGRGLGLAAVLGIVRGLRGAISVQSTPGQGTTMQLAFPASERPVGDIGPPA
jgi:signal transduction histidine kinase